jgi:hypothetical protein
MFEVTNAHPSNLARYTSGWVSAACELSQTSRDGEGSAGRRHTQAGLRAADVRAAVAELCSGGIVFEEDDLQGVKTVEGVADVGGVSAAWFTTARTAPSGW